MTGCLTVDLGPIRALRERRRALIDEDIPLKEASRLVERGARPDFYVRIRALATGTGRDYWLAHAGEALMLNGGLRVEETFSWLEFFARGSAPDLSQLVSLLVGGDAPTGEDAPVKQWMAAAGSLAPLAWAAGLSIEEARTRCAAGDPDVAGWRTLAVLRGYRLPEDFEADGRS